MSKICNNCENIFELKVTINNKIKKLSNARKYCLTCSPPNINPMFIKRNNLLCTICNQSNPQNGEICMKCAKKKQKEEKRENIIYGIVGTACWYCNYDKGMKGIPILDFHHLNPSDKIFGINRRTNTHKWDKVYDEIKKCALLCSRCHREVHTKLILEEEINKIYIDKWKTINKLHKIELKDVEE